MTRASSRRDQEIHGQGPHWIKSSFSFSNGNCVEVAHLPGGHIGVRDSKDPAGPILRFTLDEWSAFLGGARNGEFDGFGKELSPLTKRRAALGLFIRHCDPGRRALSATRDLRPRCVPSAGGRVFSAAGSALLTSCGPAQP